MTSSLPFALSSPSGELTEEEWALLQVHLAYCDICRVAFEQYQQIASDVVPLMAVSAASEPDSASESSSFSLESAEKATDRQLDSSQDRDGARHSQRRSWKVLGVVSLPVCAHSLAGRTAVSPLQRLNRVTQRSTVARIEGGRRLIATLKTRR